MARPFCIAALLFAALPFAIQPSAAQSPAPQKPRPVHNNLMYPPAPAAKPFIDLDGAGFTIDGHREYLSSGTIHYARVPHELWSDRLLRLKRGSFAGVETYAFWNYQEPVEGQWDFTGDHDFGGFLSTAQSLGLYATVRVGPYVCAEWDSGGYPVWLRFKPTFNLRTDNPEWLHWNDHWYDKILPLVANHQIDRGGNIILVQLENEHPQGWGVVPNDPYFVHLHDDAIRNGITVPFFMSGQNHGGAPKPGVIDPAKLTSPWITTEFWAGWFDAYRTLEDKKNRAIQEANWTILAHGGGGHNFYMLHGGSNFASWSDDSTGSSYDYGAAIGQAGDLRQNYYKMKRANQLAASFPEILGNSNDAGDRFKDLATHGNIKLLGARESRSGAGTLVFLQNASPKAATAQLASGANLTIPRFTIYPLPVNVDLGDGARIVKATLPILGVAHNDHVATMVFYGRPGDTGKLNLSAPGKLTIAAGCKNFATNLSDPKDSTLALTIPSSGVSECELSNPTGGLRILAISKDLSLYTWFIGPENAPEGPRVDEDIVVGPAFVQSIQHRGSAVSAIIERAYGDPGPGQIAIYGARGQMAHLAAPANLSFERQPAPTLGTWTMSTLPEVTPHFDDTAWKHSPAPLPMGADGDYGSFAWYRTTVDAPTAGPGTLQLQGADNLEVFINGRHAPNTHGRATAEFHAGSNTIAVFVSHHGRDKLYNYLGPLDTKDVKGLTAANLQLGSNTMPITQWSMRGGVDTDLATATWKPLADTATQPTLFRTTFQATPPAALGAHPILRVQYAGLTRGMIWVNGHALGRYPEKIHIESLYIPEPWLNPSGENTLAIFDETGASPVGARLIIEQAASREVLRASVPIDPDTPMVVPQEDPARDLAALNRGNLAFGKPATASASAPGSSPSAATDGDPDSAWSAPNNAINPTLTVDLEAPAELGICEVLWDQPARNYKYTLEGSTDGQTWTRLGDQTTAVPTSPDSPSELSRLNLPNVTARYIRVTIHSTRAMSIADIRLFGKTPSIISR
jgi:beta-galactosidase